MFVLQYVFGTVVKGSVADLEAEWVEAQSLTANKGPTLKMMTYF